MKKFVKWVVLIVLSLIFVVIFTISISVWFVFNPARITPIVRTQAAKYITCKSEIGQVELTFFSTFPRFGLKVNRFALINPILKAPADTLVCADQFVGIVDAAAWWKRDELVLTELQISNGTVNAFVDSLGHTNFDIVRADTTAVTGNTAQSSKPFRFINIADVALSNINLTYIDQSQKLNAKMSNLTAHLSGSFFSDTISTLVKFNEGIV